MLRQIIGIQFLDWKFMGCVCAESRKRKSCSGSMFLTWGSGNFGSTLAMKNLIKWRIPPGFYHCTEQHEEGAGKGHSFFQKTLLHKHLHEVLTSSLGQWSYKIRQIVSWVGLGLVLRSNFKFGFSFSFLFFVFFGENVSV